MTIWIKFTHQKTLCRSQGVSSRCDTTKSDSYRKYSKIAHFQAPFSQISSEYQYGVSWSAVQLRDPTWNLAGHPQTFRAMLENKMSR